MAGREALVEDNGFTLRDLALLTGASVVGDCTAIIVGAAPLYEVTHGQITLWDGARVEWSSLRAAAVVASEPIPDCRLPQLITANPRSVFARIIETFQPALAPSCVGVAASADVHPSAKIADSSTIDARVSIGKNVVIGERCHIMAGTTILDHCHIGDDCTLFPNVTLYERTVLGKRVVVHAGTVLGAYGFGYRQSQGAHIRTAQLGYVIIEDDVELGACVTIDRGTYGSTRIGSGTKIDNQVMIGHNCQIGRHNLICSQVGIAGSCRTGDYVVLAGQVGLKDHITLGDGAIVGAQAGVMDDLPGGQVYLGSPATTQKEQMQIMAVQRRLPEMRRAIKQLEKQSEQTHAQKEASSAQPASTLVSDRAA